MYLKTDILKAVYLFAGDGKDGRNYLAGVHFEKEDDKVRVTATNGHYLFTGIACEGERTPFDPVIVPVDVLKKALTGHKDAVIEFDPAANRVGDMVYSPVEDVFPDWRRLNPGEPSGKTAQFDSNYLATFAKAGKALGIKYPLIGHNGDGPALVAFSDRDDCLGLIMPVRGGDFAQLDHMHRLSLRHFESALSIAAE